MTETKTLEDINKELSEFYESDKHIQSKIRSLESEKRKHLVELYPKVYRIWCMPDVGHVAHSVGVFSTAEKAESYIPESRKSHDDEDNCTWYYSVQVVKATEKLMKHLDESPPSHFPYSGW